MLLPGEIEHYIEQRSLKNRPKSTCTGLTFDGLTRKAIKRKTGARGLRSILEASLLDVMFDLPGQQHVSKVVLDENAIEAGGKPLLIYAETAKVAGSN